MAVDLAAILARELAKHGAPVGVQAATLTLYASGTRTVGAEGAGTNPTSTAHACDGFVEEVESTSLIDGQLVRQTRTVISILGGSTDAVPVKGAKIAIAGTTYRVVSVSGDGVSAVWECTCVK